MTEDLPLSPAEIVEKAPALVKTPEGLAKLEKLAEQMFPLDRVLKLIDDLCTAEDIRMTRTGEAYKIPNWEARKAGLDRVMEVMRLKRHEAGMLGDGSGLPVKIIVNVVNPQLEVKAVSSPHATQPTQ